VIFVDCNVPMYLIGVPHPNRDLTLRLVERCIARDERLVTDAEVFQEVLHRYHALRRLEFAQRAFEVLQGIVDDVFAVELADVALARTELQDRPGLSARDALHLAVMKRRDVSRILSFDTGFDRVEGIERLHRA
jgi:hypothetical protein